MDRFVDPRTTPAPQAARPPLRTTADPAHLEELHQLCRRGCVYDVERWIAAGQPLQLSENSDSRRRRTATALGIALKQQNQALVLLLLCNGYDPNLEPTCPLDRALDGRRPDLVELLLSWGAAPHAVDREKLFDSYEASLFERFYHLGIDLTLRHTLAEALGYHTSNKPLFGFVKRYRESDARLQQELDIALAHHASKGNEKGALLCLWAGGDPHARVPMLGYYEEEDDDEEDEGYGGSAIFAACAHGHTVLLERFEPDPTRENYDELFSAAASAAIVDVLARKVLPTDMTAVVHAQACSAGWSFGGRQALDALRRILEVGARWKEASPENVGEIRRTLLRLNDSRFKDIVLLLGTEDYCSADIRRELARTGAFQKRLQAVELMPGRDDRWWQRRRGAPQMKAASAAFGLELPSPSQKRRRR